MGYASPEGKAFAINTLRSYDLNPDATFLDLGCGAGSWLEAVKPWFLESKWIGVEVWKPYIEQYSLHDRYDLVIEQDIRGGSFPTVDVVLLGDVLEHMTKEEAIDAWKNAREAARVGVFASTPIIHYEQGHVHGNPYQEHVITDWKLGDILLDLPGIVDFEKGSVCGCFFAPGLAAVLPDIEVVRAGQ